MIKYYLLSPLSSSHLRHAAQNQQKWLSFVDSSSPRINWQFFIWSAYNLRVTALQLLAWLWLSTGKQRSPELLAHASQNCSNLYFLCKLQQHGSKIEPLSKACFAPVWIGTKVCQWEIQAGSTVIIQSLLKTLTLLGSEVYEVLTEALAPSKTSERTYTSKNGFLKKAEFSCRLLCYSTNVWGPLKKDFLLGLSYNCLASSHLATCTP